MNFKSESMISENTRFFTTYIKELYIIIHQLSILLGNFIITVASPNIISTNNTNNGNQIKMSIYY